MDTSKLIKDPKTGLFARPDTWDQGVLNERKCYLPMETGPGDVFFDIGGNIGSTVDLMLHQGAKSVLTFEPDVENMELLLYNLEQAGWKSPEQYTPFAVAIVPDSYIGAMIPLYINEKGSNKATHTTLQTRGRPSHGAVALKWSILKQMMIVNDATKVKIDIEGGEFSLPIWDVPSTVDCVCVEYHVTRKGHREKANQYEARMIADGWTPIKPLRLTPKQWTVLQTYHREV